MNITVPVNRKRIPFVFVIALLITIFLVFNLIYTKTDDMYMDGLFNWIFNSLILITPLTFTIISLADYIKTKFDKKALLVISDEGLHDNLSIFSCGNISWYNISNVQIFEAMKTKFLLIKSLNPEKYLTSKSIIVRFILKKYIKKWGTPIVISQSRIDFNLEELKEIILTYQSK